MFAKKNSRLHADTYGIGQLSKRTGCNIETIRFYEREGLLPSPPRTAGGHRLYAKGHLKRLNFVCRGRQLGFTLQEVRELLELVDGGDFTCEEVHGITVAHLQSVQSKIADLRRLERALKKMADECTGETIPECPIVDTLYGL